MNKLILFLGLILLAPLSSPAANKVVPSHPKTLLKKMPQQPRLEGQWTMETSRASNEFQHDWLMTVAERVYRSPATGDQPERSLHLQVTDTGKEPTLLQLFQDLEPGPTPYGKAVLVEGLTMVLAEEKEAGITTCYLGIGQRFVVTAKLNDPSKEIAPEDFADWLATSLLPLTDIKSKSIARIPRPFNGIVVNELDPSQNRIFRMTYLTGEESQDHQERLVQQLKAEKTEREKLK